MRAALTFSESNLLEFVEFAPPAAQLAAEIARSLEPVLGVLWKRKFTNFCQFKPNCVKSFKHLTICSYIFACIVYFPLRIFHID